MPPRSGPDPLTTTVIVVALCAVSSSGPLIVFAAAPALAIAFWRNALAVAGLAPVAATRRRAELVALAGPKGRRTGLWCVLAGIALAAHFGTWIPSAKLTSVAAATALGATQPVWQGLIARGQGLRLRRYIWAGIGVAVAGAMLATGADFQVSGRAVAGDLLALGGGFMAAVYTAFGERARATISTTTYTTVCYAVCAATLGIVCLSGGVRLGGFDSRTWLAIAALTAGPQLLGHSLLNYALRRVSATTISVLVLIEAPGAALLAWAWLGQVPRVASLPGLAVLILGVLVVLLGSAQRVRPPTEPPLS